MLHILVFSRNTSEFISWSKLHEALSNFRDKLRIIALIEEPVTQPNLSESMDPDIIISGKSYNERILSLPTYIEDNDFVLPTASDDILLNIFFPTTTNLEEGQLGFQPKCFFGNQNIPAKSNEIFLGQPLRSTKDRFRRYYSAPFPHDNSIYYGMFLYKEWFSSFRWSLEKAGGIEKAANFHAFDWLWMSKLIYTGPIAPPNDHFIITRDPNSWKKYHQGIDYRQADFTTGNPLWPLILILLKEYPEYDLADILFDWFEIKTHERVSLTSEAFPTNLYLKFINELKALGLVTNDS